MDQASAEVERKKIIDKLFLCSETPIKEWIADYINEPVTKVFPDYNAVDDVIGFCINEGTDKQTYYTASLVYMEPDQPAYVSKELLKHEEVKKSVSMLYDAVRIVIPGVAATSEPPYNLLTNNLNCEFLNDNLAFRLVKENAYKKEYITIQQQLSYVMYIMDQANVKIDELNKLLNDSQTNPDDYSELQKNINDIDTDMLEKEKICKELYEKLKTIPKEKIQIEDEKCAAENIQLNNYNWMYIVVDVADAEESEYGLSRLPVLASTFIDPDEESLCEKLKKM